MTLINLNKAPFPWFGGKSKAASLVWALLGDVDHYAEPFFGSGAVLLNRPHPCNRPYHSETVNDLDGFLVNLWRSTQWQPEATARAASWPVTEADKTARQIALLRWRDAGGLERLAGDPTWCEPVMAGWWAWAVCVQIGAFDGRGPWTADPVTGRIYKQPPGKSRQAGESRNRPHLGDNGMGVNIQTAREPGVNRDRVHLGDNGMGVNIQTAREPGVNRDLVRLSDNGVGVNHAGAREPGVNRDLPRLSDDGVGVNHAGAREPGVILAANGALGEITEAHGGHALDDIDWGQTFHDATMPELVRWFRYLSARLRHVRVLNGDWSRLVTGGALKTLSVRQKNGVAGVFLDPPYADTANRSKSLYAADSLTVAHDVREWCLANGDNPSYRIVLAGYDGEHGDVLERAGWTVHEWYKAGHLQGGYGNIAVGNGTGDHQQKRERLWASPHCLVPLSRSPSFSQFTPPMVVNVTVNVTINGVTDSAHARQLSFDMLAEAGDEGEEEGER